MKMDYTAEVLRGWPADGARERLEIVSAGATLVNGDVVQMQADGTVNKVVGVKTRHAGLVVRGNGDSASGANVNGKFMTQVAKAASGVTFTPGAAGYAGTATYTSNGHGLVAGQQIVASGFTQAGFNGTFTIISANTNTITCFSTIASPGATSAGFVTLSGVSTSGKAVVLWGNYIVRTKNFLAGSWVPGAAVTAINNQFALCTSAGNAEGVITFATALVQDPEIGFVLRNQAAVGGANPEDAHVVIAVY